MWYLRNKQQIQKYKIKLLIRITVTTGTCLNHTLSRITLTTLNSLITQNKYLLTKIVHVPFVYT